MNKKSIALLIMSLFILNFTFGALSDQEQKIDSTTKSTSSPSSGTVDNGGNYVTETKIISSKNEFNQKKFNPTDFEEWIDLYTLSRAIESYHVLIKKGLISKRGFVLADIIDKELGINYSKGDIVKIVALTEAYHKQFTGNELISLLQTAQVLDNSGYIMGSETFSIQFNNNDFSTVESNLLNVSFGFENTKVNKLLASDLYRLILSQSNIIIVDQLKTHNYQSKKTGGFLDSLVDSIAGNVVGNIFHPDTVLTTRSTATWNPQFNPYDFFDIYYGFNDFPNQYDNRGLVGIYGNKGLNVLKVSQLKVSGIDKYSIDLSTRAAVLSKGAALVPYGLLGLNYDEFKDSSGSIGFYNAYVSAGGASQFATIEMGVGLVYRRGLAKNGLGFSWMFGGDFYLVKPFYVLFSSKGYAQPNFIAEKNNWDYYEYLLGIGANFMNVAVEWGYQWNKITDGWYGSMKLYF